MNGKRIAGNAYGDVRKRLKASDATAASTQNPRENNTRNVVVRIMSGQIVFHANLEASMRIADLHRRVMHHYPGNAVSLTFANKCVQLQRQLGSLEACDPMEFHAVVGKLIDVGAKSFVVNLPHVVIALSENATLKMLTCACNREFVYNIECEFLDAVCGHTILYGDNNGFSSAVLCRDGSVVTWGKDVCGSVRKQLLSGVLCLQSATGVFAAVKENGTIITWGQPDYDAASNLLLKPPATFGAVCLVNTERAFAAIQKNGSVIAWGDPDFGGDAHRVSEELNSGVIKLCSNEKAIAAMKNDGSVCTWGNSRCGGRGSSETRLRPLLQSGVIDVTATSRAFAILKQDGSVTTWGSRSYGADASVVHAELQSGVYTTEEAFAAIKKDGSMIIWGTVGHKRGIQHWNPASKIIQVERTSIGFAVLEANGCNALVVDVIFD
eukprot:12421829-Karenia_brevis.AAC.1